jgi:serine/threonine-protein kinase
MVVSLGRGIVQVPQVAGESLRHAELILAREGIPVGSVARTYDEAPEDQVLRVAPRVGSPIIRGQTVDLLLSAGAAPETYLMADFTGGRSDAVGRGLRRLGFRVEVRHVEGWLSRDGMIASQLPLPGNRVAVGDTITLLVREVQ